MNHTIKIRFYPTVPHKGIKPYKNDSHPMRFYALWGLVG